MAVALAMGPRRHDTGSTQLTMHTAFNEYAYSIQSTAAGDGDGAQNAYEPLES